MSAIDLIILGMIKEKTMSAYDLQKNVEYRHISKWVKISTPSVYKKVITLENRGYIKGKNDNENSIPGKVIYSITEEGNEYFISLMKKTSEKMVNVFLDFNAVIVNLNNIDKELGLSLAENISREIDKYYSVVDEKITEREHIPFTGKTILKQQLMVGEALKEWSEEFIKTYRDEGEK
ncbi:PadR family transcriptional regulator [Anaerofustis stercorihominis]|uniref:PadR family transcriptional regulator n=1 Tax=Anaerofustis stercorihominis TaxID=214853 RepID=UPI00214BAA43|nr:PadR family transcriptional regulator [Anaerofustis stercorihominis]MCR2033841.1 PadR family transcriptional regulator [Anaerofustis stercorihominis]